LTAQTEELASLQTRLEEVTKNAASEQEKLTAEIQGLNAKLEEIGTSARNNAPSPNSANSLDIVKADLENAKARITELESMVDSHQKAQADLETRHGEISSEVAQLEDSAKQLKQQLDEAIAAKEAAIAEVSSQHAKELESKLDDARIEFEAEKSSLESRLGELERQSQDAQRDSAAQFETTLSAELTRKTEEASQKHAEELEQLNALHASRTEALTNEHESALQSLRTALETRIAEAEKAQAEIQEAAASSDAARKEENAKELTSAVEAAKSTAKEESESIIATLKEEHAAALAKLEAEITEINKSKSGLNKELDELKSQNEAFTSEKQVKYSRLLFI
jgi:DNA repair exonuclease SbcCD ATPase subunit